jgi:protein required for attachment to host cells
MHIPNESLVLIADGGKMLLYRNSGNATQPHLELLSGEEPRNPPDRDQKSDLAGRRPAGGTPGQASVGETDYHQRAEDEFGRSIAERLNAMALRNEILSLVVVAPGKVLGVLRKHFHEQTRARVIAEIEKDLTGHPTDRILALLMEREKVG